MPRSRDPNINAVITSARAIKERDGLLADGYWPLSEHGPTKGTVIGKWDVPHRSGPDVDLNDHKLRWWVPLWVWLLVNAGWPNDDYAAMGTHYRACVGDPCKKRVVLHEEKMRLSHKSVMSSLYFRALEAATKQVEKECRILNGR